jgi:hypothetical protein
MWKTDEPETEKPLVVALRTTTTSTLLVLACDHYRFSVSMIIKNGSHEKILSFIFFGTTREKKKKEKKTEEGKAVFL